MTTTAVATFRGTGLIEEPIVEVVDFQGSRIAAGNGWGNRMVNVVVGEDVVPAFMDEIFISAVRSEPVPGANYYEGYPDEHWQV